jgi:membrane associated rhomboid family serine protease
MNIINEHEHEHEREHEQSNGNNTNIIIESSANNDLIYYTFNRNGLLSYYIHSKHRNFLYIIFNLLVWGSYVTGLFFLENMSTDKISPNFEPLFFGIVSYYPDCRDIRFELWRFFTMSIVHANIKHIICNTIILFPLMYIIESSYHYKLVLLIYGFVSIYSGITYSYFYPYTKVIGCSHIVFAYTGSLLADYTINSKYMDKIMKKMLLFTIFIIIAIEIISFFYIKVENVAYLFHWLGFVYGFIISLTFMWDKRTNKYNVKYLFISSNILSMLSVFFIYTYITNWIPQNINFLGNNISNSCCYQIFTENQIQNKCRL